MLGPHLGHERPDRSGQQRSARPPSGQVSGKAPPPDADRRDPSGFSDTEESPVKVGTASRLGCPTVLHDEHLTNMGASFVWDSDKLQRLPLLVKTAAMLPLILQEAT
jgi:hypothetical protein